MRLLRIAALDWMAYPAFELDLADVDQVAITGLNNHGKSAILDALTWCLFARVGRDVDQRTPDQLVRRRGDGMTRVVVEFETSDGHRVVVTREKALTQTMTLDVLVDGTSRRGHKLEDTQRTIEEWVGLPYAALVAGPFMVQREPGLMALDPRVRKDLLIRLLGLDRYEVLYARANSKVKDAESDLRLAEATLAGLATTLESEAEVRAEHVAAEAAMAEAEKALAAATARANAAHQALVEAKGKAEQFEAIEGRAAAIERAIAGALTSARDLAHREGMVKTALGMPAPSRELPEAVDPESLAGAARRLAEARDARERYIRADATLTAGRERLSGAESRRAILPTVPCHGEGIYAACQFLAEVPSDEALEAGRAKLAQYEAALPALQAWADQVPGLEAEHARLANAGQAYELAVTRAQAAQSHWETAQATAERGLADIGQAKEQLRDRLVADRAERERLTADLAGAATARDALAALTAEATEANAQVQSWTATMREAAPRLHGVAAALVLVERAKTQQAETESARADAASRLATYGLLAKAWHRDGVPTAIIENAVPAIEARANEVLSRLPEDLAVSLRTQRPTKSAGMAELLDVVVTVNGEESAYGLISIGAQFRVDLALRIALGELLAHRSGRRIETLWLDEPLADLDAPSREAVVETLAALGDEFGLMVVVSHHADFHDRLPSRIHVEQTAGVSSLGLVA